MIIATTPIIEGKPASVHLGLVAAEVIFGANLFKDFIAGGADLVGGRNRVYEKVFADARLAALKEIERQAEARGANAILGVRVDYQVLGGSNGMLMATASGTAVAVPLNAEERRRDEEGDPVHYLDFDGQRRGPFSIEQLRDLVSKARITRDLTTYDDEGRPGRKLGELVDATA